MKKYPLIIVGSGPSGLMLSYLIPSSLLIEKKEVTGAKILVSGGGKCNFTHEEEKSEVIKHYYEKRNFVLPSIYNFGPKEIRSFFRENGVDSYSEGGKVFPLSNNSEDIKNVLESKNKNIMRNTNVLSIEKENDIYIVHTTNGAFSSPILALATGGSPNISSYSLLSSLSHKIIKPHPSLAPITLKMDVKKIEGIQINDVIIKSGKNITEGPIIFTHDSISGPAALNHSHYISSLETLTLTFTKSDITNIKSENAKSTVIKAIHNITKLPLRFIQYLFPEMNKTIAELTKKDLNTIQERLYRCKLEAYVKGNGMVTRGGVDCNEVKRESMESKINSNLYLLGEMLDVDGECGGYNITFALASAYTAALDIKKKNPNLI